MIARKSILMLSSRMVSAILSLIAYFFLWRYLGVDNYGLMTWAITILTTINVFSDLGFATAHIKRISEGMDEGDCFSTFLVIRVVLIAVVIGITLGLIFLWGLIFYQPMTSESINVILIFLLYYLLYDLAGIATYTFDSKMQTAKTQLAFVIDPIIRVPLIIWLALDRSSAQSIGWAYVVGAAAMLFVAFYYLYKENIRWKKPTLFKSYLKFAFPVAIIMVFATLSTNLDKIFIGAFWTTNDVAYYFACQSLLNLMGMVGAVLTTLLLPALSSMFAKGQLDIIKEKTVQVERYVSLMLVPLTVVILLVPYDVARIIFGGLLEPSGSALRFLSVSTLINLMGVVYVSQLYAFNRPDIVLKITGIGMIFNFGLLLVLVPPSIYGVKMMGLSYTGAAIATLLSMVLTYVLTRTSTRDMTGIEYNKRIALHLLSGLLSSICVYIVVGFWSIEHWYDLAGVGLISYGTFLSALIIFKEFDRDDFRFILANMSIKEMRKYLKEEFRKPAK